MACLEMYNSDHHHHRHHNHCAPMSPRISFSNDFAETPQMIKQDRSSFREPPVSSDFEFSVTNYSMMSADELFCKGKLLPFKDNCSGGQMQRTLRDELLVGDEDDDGGGSGGGGRPPKGSSSSSTRWKGLLGLRRTHIGSKKLDNKNDETKKQSARDMVSDGGSSCRNVEIGI